MMETVAISLLRVSRTFKESVSSREEFDIGAVVPPESVAEMAVGAVESLAFGKGKSDKATPLEKREERKRKQNEEKWK